MGSLGCVHLWKITVFSSAFCQRFTGPSIFRLSPDYIKSVTVPQAFEAIERDPPPPREECFSILTNRSSCWSSQLWLWRTTPSTIGTLTRSVDGDHSARQAVQTSTQLWRALGRMARCISLLMAVMKTHCKWLCSLWFISGLIFSPALVSAKV